MGDLFTMPELWLGLGAVGMVVYTLLFSGKETKQMQARLARISKTGKPNVSASAEHQSLRRKDPSAEGRFGDSGIVTTLRGKLELAGMRVTPQKLLRNMAIAFGVILAVMAGLLGKPLLVSLLVALMLSVGGANFVVRRKIGKRQRMFLKLFPEAIDLIVRGLRAGLPVAESFTTVAREIPDPVGIIFATMTQQIQLGMTMERALAEAAAKLDMTEFNFFVTTIILQRETGGNLGEILNNLSETLRQRQMMKLKIFALSSEARASGIIVGSLPFFVFGVLNLVSPEYLDRFYDDYRGNIALLGAIGIMTLGGLVMRRMSQLEI